MVLLAFWDAFPSWEAAGAAEAGAAALLRLNILLARGRVVVGAGQRIVVAASCLPVGDWGLLLEIMLRLLLMN